MQVGGKTTRLFLLQSSFQERNPSVTLSNIKQPAENKNCLVAHLSLAPIKQLEFFYFSFHIYIYMGIQRIPVVMQRQVANYNQRHRDK
jgi:hypothetical protein